MQWNSKIVLRSRPVGITEVHYDYELAWYITSRGRNYEAVLRSCPGRITRGTLAALRGSPEGVIPTFPWVVLRSRHGVITEVHYDYEIPHYETKS